VGDTFTNSATQQTRQIIHLTEKSVLIRKQDGREYAVSREEFAKQKPCPCTMVVRRAEEADLNTINTHTSQPDF
jgi:hypothetical protein